MSFDELDAFLVEYQDAAKLPERVKATVNQILLEATPAQFELIQDTHRKIAVRSPRRVGKTSGFLRRFCHASLKGYNRSFRYVALSRPHAEELLWIPLKRLVEDYKIPGRFHEGDLEFQFRDTGSILKLVGADDKKESDKMRGGAHDGIAIDEAAAFPAKLLRYIMDQVARYTLIDRKGWLLLGGTPGQTLAGEFYEATRVGALRSRPYRQQNSDTWSRTKCRCPMPCPDFEWSLHTWSADDAALPDLKQEFEAILQEKGWSVENPIYQREAMGNWAVDDSGRVYRYRKYLEEREWNVWTPSEKTKENPFGLPGDHKWRFSLGIDLGNKKVAQEERARNPDRQIPNRTALELVAFSETCRTLYHCLEIVRPLEGVTGLAGIIKWIETQTGGPFEIFVDLAGAGGLVLDELATVHGIAAEAAEKKNKVDAIELINSDMIDGHFKVMEGSQLEMEMLSLQWDEDGIHENKSQANDCCDAAIYARRGALHTFSSEIAKRHDVPSPTDLMDAIEKQAEQKRKRGNNWEEDLGGYEHETMMDD